MNRRKFIAATSVGVGMAGCLTGNGTDSGNDGTDGDGTDDANIDVNDTEEGSHSSDSGADGNGSQNDGDNSSTDPEPDESDDSSTDETEETDGEDDDEGETDDPSGRTTSFESCARATVSGSFADGDVAFASTGFYDEGGLFGNTMIEDGVVFGDSVDAPFSGTVVFEIGDGAGVSEGSDEIVVTVPDYGGVGTVITSLTTDQADYAAGAPTTPNPHAEDCLRELEAEAGGGDGDSDAGGDDGDADGNDSETDGDAAASFAVSILDTNSPVDAGDYLEGTVEVRNTGGAAGSDTVDLVVGNDPTTVESRSVSLEAGERTTFTMGYQTPPVAADQQFPVRVETADDSDRQSVRVRGVQ